MFLPAIALAAESAEESAGGLASLGLNVSGLIFQIVNFAILLFILYRFAYKPLLKVLEKRRQVITESLQSAAHIEQQRKDMETEQRSVIVKARQEAEAIVGRGEKAAQLIQTQAETEGKKAAERLLTQAEAKVAQQIRSAQADLKRETLNLVVAATEEVLEEKLDEPKDQALIERAIAKAETALPNSGSL